MRKWLTTPNWWTSSIANHKDSYILPHDSRSQYGQRKHGSKSSRLSSRGVISLCFRVIVLVVILRVIWKRSELNWIYSTIEESDEVSTIHDLDQFVNEPNLDSDRIADHYDIQTPTFGAVLDVHGQIVETAPDDEEYLFYLPEGGLSNQFISFMKAIGIASDMNRTLIAPPIVRTGHESIADSIKQFELWTKFFDFSTISPRILFYDPMHRVAPDIKPLEILPSRGEVLKCHATGPRASTLHEASLPRRFTSSAGWVLSDVLPEWEGVYADMPTLAELVDILGTERADEKTVCLTGTFFLRVQIWEEYTKRLQFKGYVASLSDQWIESLNGEKEYVAVHWRRGDFKEHCQGVTQSTIDFYQGAKCWPSIEEAIKLIEAQRGELPVVILTNTDTKTESDAFKQAGYSIVDHASDNMSGVVRELLGPVFGDSIVDSAIASSPRAKIFIGNRYSTWTQLAVLRARARQTKIVYF